MKMHWLLFTILLFSNFSHAQSVGGSRFMMVQAVETYSRFSLGVFYSPEVSYRFLGIRKGENESTMQPIIDWRNELETFKYGHTTGIQLNYLIGPKFSIESGISYSLFGEQTKPTDLVAWNGNTSTFIGTYVGINSYHYVSVPISVQYTFGKSALKYFVSTGLSASFLAGQSNITRIEYADGGLSESTTSSYGASGDFNKMVLGAHLSAGIQYHISSRFSVRFAPVFRMTATSIIDAPITEYYFNTGIETGVRMRL